MLKALRPFVDWHAHGRGEFPRERREHRVRGRLRARPAPRPGTWFFDDGLAVEGTLSRDDAKGLGTYRWTEEVKEKDEDGAYVVVDRKNSMNETHDLPRQPAGGLRGRVEKGCRLRLPPLSVVVYRRARHRWWEGPPNLWNGPWRRPSGGCLRSREGALHDQRGGEGYRDAPRRHGRSSPRGPAGRDQVPPALRPLEYGARGRLADVPFVLDDHKPLIHHFARDEHLDLKRYDVTDAERRARPPSPTPTQALATFATAAGRSRGPSPASRRRRTSSCSSARPRRSSRRL